MSSKDLWSKAPAVRRKIFNMLFVINFFFRGDALIRVLISGAVYTFQLRAGME